MTPVQTNPLSWTQPRLEGYLCSIVHSQVQVSYSLELMRAVVWAGLCLIYTPAGIAPYVSCAVWCTAHLVHASWHSTAANCPWHVILFNLDPRFSNPLSGARDSIIAFKFGPTRAAQLKDLEKTEDKNHFRQIRLLLLLLIFVQLQRRSQSLARSPGSEKWTDAEVTSTCILSHDQVRKPNIILIRY